MNGTGAVQIFKSHCTCTYVSVVVCVVIPHSNNCLMELSEYYCLSMADQLCFHTMDS